jgi:branched-chain amino acid transport system permease protein
MAQALTRCGDFKTSYRADTTIFPSSRSRAFVLAGIALAIVAPLQIGGVGLLSDYWVTLLIQIGYLAIAALGLNILVGFTGQISLGHSAFFGFGAFASAWLNNTYGIPVFFSIPLAALWTTAVGLVVGIPAGRIKGLYLAIATLASQFILQDFFARAEWFTGGSSGSLAAPFSLFGFEVSGDRHYFYVVLAYLVAMTLLATNLMRSRDGRALIAIRDHPIAATAMGINLPVFKSTAFGVSAAFTGVAGALGASVIAFVSPDSFTVTLSIFLLVGMVVGGLATIPGAFFGALFIQFVPNIADEISKSAPAAIYGVLLIVLMYLMPTGVLGLVRPLWSRHRPGAAPGPPAGAAATGVPVPPALTKET